MIPNNYDFTTPQRQSPVAILLVLTSAFTKIIRNVWPIFIVIFLGQQSSTQTIIILSVAIGITIISSVYSIINYFKTYFYIQGNELIHTSGIIGKKRLSIPFDKILSVNFEQNVLHRIFNVKKLKIDTAGSTQKEFEINALNNDVAEALRSKLLDFKLKTKPALVEEETEINVVKSSNEKVILKLGILDLIKAGLMENHLKSVGLIVAFFWWIYQNLQEVGIDTDSYIKKNYLLFYGVMVMGMLTVITLIISIIISLIRTVIKYYQLQFLRINRGFKITYGLFNTQTISALDNKIQTVSWSDNLLKRLIGIFDLKLKQASSKEVTTKESILIPGCHISHVNQVLSNLYKKMFDQKIDLQKVHQSLLNRQLFFIILFTFVLSVTVIILGRYWEMIAVFGLCLYLTLTAIVRYKKLEYGYNDQLIRIKGGVFGDKNVITPILKLQSISKSQSPFQRKRNLVTLHLHNASGSETIPYIYEETADHIINTFLMKVEMDKGW